MLAVYSIFQPTRKDSRILGSLACLAWKSNLETPGEIIDDPKAATANIQN